MLNYWWVTRPKRKLNSIPEVLATFANLSLNQEWSGQRDSHLGHMKMHWRRRDLSERENVEINKAAEPGHIKPGL